VSRISSKYNKHPSPVAKKPAGISRRLVGGKYQSASAGNTELFSKLVEAIQRKDQKAKKS
jgi:hypothetical protein